MRAIFLSEGPSRPSARQLSIKASQVQLDANSVFSSQTYYTFRETYVTFRDGRADPANCHVKSSGNITNHLYSQASRSHSGTNGRNCTRQYCVTCWQTSARGRQYRKARLRTKNDALHYTSCNSTGELTSSAWSSSSDMYSVQSFIRLDYCELAALPVLYTNAGVG